MKTAVFVGPSLAQSVVKDILPNALILPPAEQGDIEYCQRILGADVIGLIDGVHSQRLPVWHKEILSVLSCRVRVFGASSMGALRCVECEPWGAEPIGEIASWYSSGKIDADDEVCLIHGNESSGYRHFSVPLVNIRSSLISANVEQARQDEIISVAQDMFYPDRNWPALFTACECSKEEQKQILDNEIDLKAADAMHLCYTLANLPERSGKPTRPIRYADKSYGAVFLNNDRKVGNGIRLHDIAGNDPKLRKHALTRQLALEFCKSAGLTAANPVTSTEGIPVDDLDDANRIRLCNEERTLERAGEWLAAAGGGFWDVPAINDLLRVDGAYDLFKNQAARRLDK